MVDEKETAYWYAVRSEDTDELDNGSYDYEEAEKLFDDEETWRDVLNDSRDIFEFPSRNEEER